MSAIPPNHPIVITTRNSDLAKTLRCRLEPIDRLNEDEAVAVLVKLLGPLDQYDAAAREIARLTEGLPLALELIAGLADSPADLPVLTGKLREKPALDVLKLLGGETAEESIEACLAMSYAALDTNMQRRFRALGVFAPPSFDQVAIAGVWNEEDEESVDEAIRLLTRRNLLIKDEEAKDYRQHALLRAYALSLLEQQGEYDEVAGGHANYYRQFARGQDWRAIEKVYEQIDWSWRWVQSTAPDQIISHVFAVQNFLRIRGRQVERLGWLQTVLTQARTERARQTEGTLLNNIGRFYDDLGRKEQALDYYQQALAIRREVGDRGGEGRTLNNIGHFYDDLGRKEQALDYYQQALAIYSEVGDRWAETVTLYNIGMLLDTMGRTSEAVRHLEQNVALDEAIGHPDLENDRAILDTVRHKLQVS
jgi:tetratricopeptide (TPR) repeat protein